VSAERVATFSQTPMLQEPVHSNRTCRFPASGFPAGKAQPWSELDRSMPNTTKLIAKVRLIEKLATPGFDLSQRTHFGEKPLRTKRTASFAQPEVIRFRGWSEPGWRGSDFRGILRFQQPLIQIKARTLHATRNQWRCVQEFISGPGHHVRQISKSSRWAESSRGF
jgi:hypothetical protein